MASTRDTPRSPRRGSSLRRGRGAGRRCGLAWAVMAILWTRPVRAVFPGPVRARSGFIDLRPEPPEAADRSQDSRGIGAPRLL